MGRLCPATRGSSSTPGLALYKAGTDADGGTWLTRDDIIALQAEAALQRRLPGGACSTPRKSFRQPAQAAKELENADGPAGIRALSVDGRRFKVL